MLLIADPPHDGNDVMRVAGGRGRPDYTMPLGSFKRLGTENHVVADMQMSCLCMYIYIRPVNVNTCDLYFQINV